MKTESINRMDVTLPAPGLRPGAGALAPFLAGLLLANPVPVLAHGTEMSSGAGRAAWVRAGYAGGEPMEFARVRVVDPQGRTHQVGNADAQGRFAWLPDQDGEWRVVAEDGMGHRGEIAIRGDWAVTPSPGPSPEVAANLSAWPKATLGLSLIFWLSGLVFWFAGRKARTRREPRQRPGLDGATTAEIADGGERRRTERPRPRKG